MNLARILVVLWAKPEFEIRQPGERDVRAPLCASSERPRRSEWRGGSCQSGECTELFMSPSKPCRIAPCAATLSRHQDGTQMSLFQYQPTHARRPHTRYRADCPRSE